MRCMSATHTSDFQKGAENIQTHIKKFKAKELGRALQMQAVLLMGTLMVLDANNGAKALPRNTIFPFDLSGPPRMMSVANILKEKMKHMYHKTTTSTVLGL